MQKRFLSTFVVLLTLMGSVSRGSDWTEVGNGGDVIVCRRGPQTYTMYDAYESEHRYGLTPKYPPYQDIDRSEYPHNSKEYFYVAAQIAQSMVERLRLLDPVRYRKYSDWISQYESEAQFLDNATLTDIPDTGIGTLPAGCYLEQLIIQRPPRFPGQPRYMIAHDFWRYMSFEDQVVAILHEVIYRDAREADPKVRSSERVRYFNALIISDKISRMSLEEYRKSVDFVFRPTP